ncbi:hypothetical protein BZA77DRAFT_354835 [Pyronema omphalodes]|nr:hypothetical protein BZA77DRAFT_354835 [Pyronema omphalodes]
MESPTHQVQRERNLERETLTDSLTTLKSLLRLEADGIGDREDLLDELERARQTIERFSITLRRQTMMISTTPPNGGFEVIHGNLNGGGITGLGGLGGLGGLSGLEEIRSDLMNGRRESLRDSIRARSLSQSSSSKGSWRSSASSVSTAPTSVSSRDSVGGNRRDSLHNRRFTGSPSPYLSKLREEEFRFTDDVVVEEEEDMEARDRFAEVDLNEQEEVYEEDEEEVEEEEEEDYHDESFERLSNILASLQKQAETAISSPTVFDVAPSPSSSPTPSEFWGDGASATNHHVNHSTSPFDRIACRRVASTPGLRSQALAALTRKSPSPTPLDFNGITSHPRHRKSGSASPHVPHSSTFPTTRVPSNPNQPPTPGVLKKRSSRPPSGIEMIKKWEDLEGLLGELLEERMGRQGDWVFGVVWVWMVSGGFLWWCVGMMLGWGCDTCAVPTTA